MRVLRGQANNDTPPMTRTEEARTGDRNDNDNRIDVVLSGNGDMPPKCTFILPNSHFLSLLCQGRELLTAGIKLPRTARMSSTHSEVINLEFITSDWVELAPAG
jgi:hypothetical protein